MRPRHLGLAALLVALFGAGFIVGKSPAGVEGPYRELDAFVEVLGKIQRDYVDPVDTKKLVHGAIDGMMKDLDPFSQYMDKAEYADLKTVTTGHFGGLGIVISVRDEFPTVISPLEGTPAYAQGIQSGDVIVKIAGASTRGWSNEEAVQKLRGPEGTDVTITIARAGEPERDYTIRREVIQVKSVPYAFEVSPGVGYIRVSTFSETTGEEVRAAIDRLEKAGTRSLILDLRDNPGGLLTQAVDVVEAFVPKGSLVVYTKGRAPGTESKAFAQGANPHTEQPLVVLSNGGSASASEIVAGAIQDLDRGLVVGTTSFGKGSVQSLIELRGSGTALKLTTAKYYTPSGRSIHRDTWNQSTRELERAADEGAFDHLPDPDAPVGAPGDSAAGDSTKRPTFKTRAGRIVYGGGGITPDELVRADTLQALSREVERRGLFFKHAVRWAAANPGATAPTTVSPAIWNAFVGLLGETKTPYTAAQLAAERGYLERGIRRELARRLSGPRGDEAAFRVGIEGDVQMAKAIDLLGRARTPGELVRLSAR
jgi:carboxyl-terminal processing protease